MLSLSTTPSTSTLNNRDMLKRQRPVTPPPSSLNDPSSSLLDGFRRPPQPSHTVDPSQPRSKRLRIRPPPLDGALRGWVGLEPASSYWESDGEEDWTEDVHDVFRPPPLPSAKADQYKDTNSLLHELHVLNQHRLLFTHLPRDRRLSPISRAPLPATTTHIQNSPAAQRPVTWTDGSHCHPASSQLSHDRTADPKYRVGSTEEKGLVEEVQCVRQRYEDANRFLGSLFLSRRREMEGMIDPVDSGSSS